MHSLKWKKEIRLSTASKNHGRMTATQNVGETNSKPKSRVKPTAR